VVPVDDFSRYLIAEHINDGKLKILKLSDIKIVLVDEYRVFSITPSIENTLKDYRTNKTSVFNSETAKLIKKNLELNNFDCVFPYLIDEARNFTEDKIDLTSTIKS
jgi:hypothetical protein